MLHSLYIANKHAYITLIICRYYGYITVISIVFRIITVISPHYHRNITVICLNVAAM